jgi:flavin-dependent dehydrogenase
MVVARSLKRPHSLTVDAPLVFMTRRMELDHFCLNRTLQAGAVFKVVKKLTSVTERRGYVEIEADRAVLRSRYLIGADGANSRIRRWCAPFPEFCRGFAMEARVPVSGARGYAMTFDFGAVPWGYGWVFPKDGHVNVGLYTCRSGVRLKARQVAAYAREKTGAAGVEKMAAHSIGLGGWAYEPASNRIFLAGDAAGLADPLLGEGLHNAIRSGQAAAGAIMAAEAARSSPPATRYRELLAPIRADLLRAARAASWFYRFPALGYAILTLPSVRHRLTHGYADGSPLSAIDILPRLHRLVVALRRWTGNRSCL